MRQSAFLRPAAALAFLIFSVAQPLRAQSATRLEVMPLPAHSARQPGRFIVDRSFNIAFEGYTEPRLQRARERFLAALTSATGLPLSQFAQYNPADFIVTTAGPSDPVQRLGEDESYRLEVSPGQVRLTAANPLGVMHGLQTFLQMVERTPQGFSAPAVTIKDAPRFPWRGLMIDTGRHFMPVEVIERNLDGMEAVKLNVFHWHLSDDQGFRAESKRFPLLEQKGSDGLYYTQDQMRQVIQYARDRGIRVVPEFDMPCHTTSWFVGYPKLASGSGPYQIARRWGVLDAAMNPTTESTYEFVNAFIGEMSAIFPDRYFHVGGDECNGKEWNANPQIQSFMRAQHLADDAALQAYFSGRVQKLVAAHQKIMEGWDEVLQPNTPKDVVIQSWRGLASLAQAARQGNRGLLSTPYYLNLNHPASEYYLADPLGAQAASLSPAEQARILGGEATMWTEYATPENIDSRMWPSLAAIAERFWSPADVRDVPSMYQRLRVVSLQLALRGLDTKAQVDRMLARMSGEQDPVPLKVLATVVQPPQNYARESLAHFDAFTPLNRMVDAVPPESQTARRFAEIASRIAAGKATPEEWREARKRLTVWRDNDAKLQPSLGDSYLTADLSPVSQTLGRIASIGLNALDHLQNGQPVSVAARQNDISALRSAAKPQAVLVDAIVPSVNMLVEATRTQ